MRFEVLNENIKRALAIANRAVSTRSSLPVLSNVLLATDEGRIRIEATNLELGIKTWVGAKVETEGKVTLPAKMLTDIVSALPNDVISFSLDTTSQVVSYSCGKFKGTIAGIDADEFPIIPRVSGTPIDLPADVLASVASRVVPFASDDTVTRPVLSGVGVSIAGTSAVFVATDSHRLGQLRHALTSPQEAISAIIPARAMSDVGRIVSGTVATYIDANQVAFVADGIEVISRLISGNYPPTDRIIPTGFDTRGVVVSSDLRASMRLAGLYESKDSKGKALASPVRFTLGNEQDNTAELTIESVKDERGNSIARIDLVLMDGPDRTIKLDSHYAADVINACGGDEVAIELQDASRPAIFRAVGDNDYFALIMPMTSRD